MLSQDSVNKLHSLPLFENTPVLLSQISPSATNSVPCPIVPSLPCLILFWFCSSSPPKLWLFSVRKLWGSGARKLLAAFRCFYTPPCNFVAQAESPIVPSHYCLSLLFQSVPYCSGGSGRNQLSASDQIITMLKAGLTYRASKSTQEILATFLIKDADLLLFRSISSHPFGRLHKTEIESHWNSSLLSAPILSNQSQAPFYLASQNPCFHFKRSFSSSSSPFFILISVGS